VKKTSCGTGAAKAVDLSSLRSCTTLVVGSGGLPVLSIELSAALAWLLFADRLPRQHRPPQPGHFQLAAGSPGVSGGQVIPNFSDGYTGEAPDLVAHQRGAPPARYGVGASQ